MCLQKSKSKYMLSRFFSTFLDLRLHICIGFPKTRAYWTFLSWLDNKLEGTGLGMRHNIANCHVSEAGIWLKFSILVCLFWNSLLFSRGMIRVQLCVVLAEWGTYWLLRALATQEHNLPPKVFPLVSGRVIHWYVMVSGNFLWRLFVV